MAFPALVPSTRTFVPGDFPVKRFVSQSGVETRVLYGSKETGARLSLSYKNLADEVADDFIIHFRSVKGTYETFPLNAEDNTNAKGGWTGDEDALEKPAGTAYRYAKQPQITSVKPGISNVKVDLVAVL